MPASSPSRLTSRHRGRRCCAESQKVEKGQALFTLNQEPFKIALAGAEANRHGAQPARHPQATYRQKQAQIEQAKTDVAFYETGYQRQQDLLKRGVAPQAAFDQAKRDLDARASA